MELRPRTRPLLRRAVAAAALGALLVPAVADAKAKAPVITKVTPKTAAVGTKLTIQGKNFKRGKAKNSVLFRRDKGKALFVKADVSTTKSLVVVVPKTLEKYMNAEGSNPIPTRFRLRVLAKKISKAYTDPKASPVISPEKDNGDCDADGVKNGVDGDDDNDLLDDAREISLLLDPCVSDTDGDGVEDGFEYQSAIDLNNDDFQDPTKSLPHLGKTPYPNPLFNDADRDFDGDSLALGIEYKLWKYTYEVNHTAARTLKSLSYSDGAQYSLGSISDDKRDEDADGLTNFDEDTGRMNPAWWTACYAQETPFPQGFAATKPFDADTDGDTVLDGADDQDFDDVPNIMELSRTAAGGKLQGADCLPWPGQVGNDPTLNPKFWVNPFNPCLPERNSRTCPRYPPFNADYPPFKQEWKPFVLN